MSRVAGEGDGVADVLDPGDEHDQPLEAETEARVRDRAVLAQVQVPSKLLLLQGKCTSNERNKRGGGGFENKDKNKRGSSEPKRTTNSDPSPRTLG